MKFRNNISALIIIVVIALISNCSSKAPLTAHISLLLVSAEAPRVYDLYQIVQLVIITVSKVEGFKRLNKGTWVRNFLGIIVTLTVVIVIYLVGKGG